MFEANSSYSPTTLGGGTKKSRAETAIPKPPAEGKPLLTKPGMSLLIATALAKFWRVVERSPSLTNLEKNCAGMLEKSRLLIHPYVQLDRGFVFIHVPKAAGTSLNIALGLKATLATSLHARAKDVMPFIHLVAPKTIAIAFVRNPYTRFVSLYNFARAEESMYHSTSNPDMAPYGKHPDYDILSDKSLEQCAELLVEGRLGNPRVWPTNWTPQVEWLVDRDRKIMVDFIGKVESIDADLQRLKKVHGIASQPTPWLNKSSNVGKLPELTPRTRELLRLFYKRDFEMLGYEE